MSLRSFPYYPPHSFNGDVQQVLHDHADARFLERMLQSEYIGRFGGPDPDPGGGLRNCEVVLVGYLRDEPVALGGWGYLSSTEGCLRRMYTVWEARGRGFSKVLLGELENTARDRGIQRMRLETDVDSHAALEMYRRSGYVAGQEFGFYAENDTSVFLVKELR